MRLSINAVKNKEADACVSAGNTGALMTLSKIILKMMPGIDINDLEVGMDVKIALDVLYEDDEYEYIVWKWDLA